MMNFFVALGVLSLLAISVDGGASMHNPFFCYSTDPIRSMTNMASVITSYEAVRRFNFTTVNPYMSSFDDVVYRQPPGCQYFIKKIWLDCIPSRFWYVGKEAARFAFEAGTQSMINLAQSSVQSDIISNYEAGRTMLCQPDFEAIRDFSMDTHFGSPFSIANHSMVMESGIIAMRNIARRLQQRFPNILPETYSRDHFHFRHTYVARNNVTIRAFASGLFGEDGSQNVMYEDIPDTDWFLRPSDFCPAFSEEVANFRSHRAAFEQGPEIQEMIEQVNRKLGFQASNQLSFHQIFYMWTWCRFKIAHSFELSGSETGADSGWCAPFSVNHHLLLEYSEELGLFYNYGYGVRNQRLVENLNCGLMQDLLTHMQSENDSDQVARIFVTHLYPILTMFVTLGTFRDVWPMHQHNFGQQTARQWLSSFIAPFNANIVVVRFDCDDGDHDLMFLLNERPLLVPGCDQETGVCKLSVFVNRFQRFYDANCEVVFCSND